MNSIDDDNSDDIADSDGTTSNDSEDSDKQTSDIGEAPPSREGDPANGVGASDPSIVVATMVSSEGPSEIIEATEVFATPREMPVSFQNLAAVGGAVGALLLGIWSIFGATISPYASINAMVGILMGFWGVTSPRKKMAIIGIVLCLIGLGLSVWEVNGIISNYLMQVEEM